MFQKFFAGLITDLLGKFTQWITKLIKLEFVIKKEKSKNKKAIDKLKAAETDAEVDDALDDIGRRTSNK